MLRRSQTGTGNSNTKYTLSAFGLEDHIYDGGGNNLNNKYYYYLAGQLIGLNNGSPNFLFTDALGSVVSSITSTANTASVKGNQVYGPYGNNPYSKGTMGTTKGYTGQYNDSLTQLDYYGARYYDPLVGVFLSADSVQGNLAGMNPYNYVGSNPQTNTDPNGEMYAPPPDAQPQGVPQWISSTSSSLVTSLQQGAQNWQPDTCTQMAQNGYPCNVQVNGLGPGQAVQYQRPGPLSLGCVELFGLCVLVTTSSPDSGGPIQGSVNPTFPVNFCIPYCSKSDEVSEGEEGASNGKESDLTRLMDDLLGNLLFAAEGGGEGESLGLGGNPGDAGSVQIPSEDNGPVHVLLPENRYPETASHIKDVADTRDFNLDETIWHWVPEDAEANRDESLAGWPTVQGKDRDEFPMASMLEGGTGADIRYIDPADNRGAGSFIAKQLGGYPSGTSFIIHIVNEWLF